MSDLANRLQSKINICKDGCWMFTGGWNTGGYGNIWDNGRTRSAHIVSYEVYIGPVPENIHVLHTCDNRWCVNPEHLFLGTSQDNIDDMINKGRDGFIGQKNGRAILAEKDIIEIKTRLSLNNQSQAEIAEDYGVTRSTIAAIKSGRNWKCVA